MATMRPQPARSHTDTGVCSQNRASTMADTGSTQHSRLAFTGPASATPCRYSM